MFRRHQRAGSEGSWLPFDAAWGCVPGGTMGEASGRQEGDNGATATCPTVGGRLHQEPACPKVLCVADKTLFREVFLLHGEGVLPPPHPAAVSSQEPPSPCPLARGIGAHGTCGWRPRAPAPRSPTQPSGRDHSGSLGLHPRSLKTCSQRHTHPEFTAA